MKIDLTANPFFLTKEQIKWVNKFVDQSKYSTHRMATAEADGVHYVYPTILRDEQGNLKQYYGDEAFNKAMQTEEAIGFNSQIDAEWFERHWKLMFDKNYKADY